MGAKYTQAQAKAYGNYLKNKGLKDIKIRVTEAKRIAYKDHAASKGISLNQLMIDLIEADIKKGQD